MRFRKIILVFLLFFFACGQKKDKPSYPSLPHYNVADPIIVHLKTDLDEISGIVYYPKDTSVFAVNDELGVLYKIFLRKKIKVNKWKFSVEGDYEDLAIVDNVFYALQSNGNIKGFAFNKGKLATFEECTVPIMGHNEFETLYYDKDLEKLVLLCKDCAADDRKTITAYSFNPADQTFNSTPLYTINAEKIAEQLGSKQMKFEPSCAAIHPITKELYIISSTNKAIVVADRNGKVKEAYRIDPRLFKQPEGISFSEKGDLLISNESADIGAPNILLFKYNPEVNEKG